MKLRALRRPPSLWMLAAIPAALIGHGVAYGLAGRPLVDSHHRWLAPTLEYSAIVLCIAAVWIVLAALSRTGLTKQSEVEISFLRLWPRLALAQCAIFAAAELAEGAGIGAESVAVQIVIACVAAAVVALFARVLNRIAALALDAGRYLDRIGSSPKNFVARISCAPSLALAVCAGRSRFQRPPPAL